MTNWLILSRVFLYLVLALSYLIGFAIYRMTAQSRLLTMGETLFGVLLMIGLPVMGSVAMIVYTYYLENREQQRQLAEHNGVLPPSETTYLDALDLEELRRRELVRRTMV